MAQLSKSKDTVLVSKTIKEMTTFLEYVNKANLFIKVVDIFSEEIEFELSEFFNDEHPEMEICGKVEYEACRDWINLNK